MKISNILEKIISVKFGELMSSIYEWMSDRRHPRKCRIRIMPKLSRIQKRFRNLRTHKLGLMSSEACLFDIVKKVRIRRT